MFYPMKFKAVYKDYLWGGRNLAALGKLLPESGIVAESWEISGHPNGVSIIANGAWAGTTLPEAVSRFGRSLVGRIPPAGALLRFPLLVKLIDACDALSVQVHPNDRFAAAYENGDSGKNEMWYVVAAQPGARLIAGIKPGVRPGDLAAAATSGQILGLLQEVPVQAGDVINIPAGVVHAIGKGLVICEIQQNSDATYRLYDYGRRDAQGNPRPLHLKKALSVIDCRAASGQPLLAGLVLQESARHDLKRRVLVLNRCFLAEELHLDGQAGFTADGGRFLTLTAIAGEGEIIYSDDAGLASLPVRMGESVLIPAFLGDWQIRGKLTLITSCVSDFNADLAALAAAAGMPEARSAELLERWAGLMGFDPLPEETGG